MILQVLFKLDLLRKISNSFKHHSWTRDPSNLYIGEIVSSLPIEDAT